MKTRLQSETDAQTHHPQTRQKQLDYQHARIHLDVIPRNSLGLEHSSLNLPSQAVTAQS
jgi:hypothetical protein